MASFGAGTALTCAHRPRWSRSSVRTATVPPANFQCENVRVRRSFLPLPGQIPQPLEGRAATQDYAFARHRATLVGSVYSQDFSTNTASVSASRHSASRFRSHASRPTFGCHLRPRMLPGHALAPVLLRARAPGIRAPVQRRHRRAAAPVPAYSPGPSMRRSVRVRLAYPFSRLQEAGPTPPSSKQNLPRGDGLVLPQPRCAPARWLARRGSSESRSRSLVRLRLCSFYSAGERNERVCV